MCMCICMCMCMCGHKVSCLDLAQTHQTSFSLVKFKRRIFVFSSTLIRQSYWCSRAVFFTGRSFTIGNSFPYKYGQLVVVYHCDAPGAGTECQIQYSSATCDKATCKLASPSNSTAQNLTLVTIAVGNSTTKFNATQTGTMISLPKA